MAPASGARSGGRSRRWAAAATPRRQCGASPRLDAGTLDAAAARYLAELHALAPDKTRIVDKMPGNFLLSRPRRPDAARRAHHPLRARSARHRPVDLHLPLPRPSRLCARSGRSRLVHRAAGPADGALARRAAEPDPDRQARRLGRRISTPRWRGCWRISICRTIRPASAFTKPTAACARSAAPRCANR